MKSIPLLDLKREYEYMKKEIDAAIDKCLQHQSWIKGPEVGELEEQIAQYIGVKHCIGVASGTDALVIALRALAIKLTGKEFLDRDDEIITTPFTFIATGDAILRAGATPVFVDIDPDTLNINASLIREYLEGEATQAVGIIPVHLFGQSCDMDAIMDIAIEKGLSVVEDTAQAFGGAWRGRKLGGLGDLGALSFFPSKNLGGYGDGGMVATNITELANMVRMLTQHGGLDKYCSKHIGYNSRLGTIQAAILMVKLRYLDELNERRREISHVYDEGLRDVSSIVRPRPCSQTYTVYNQYTILIQGGKRDALAKHLNEKGIATAIYYSLPLHHMEVFRGRMKIYGELREAESAARKVLSLPIEPLMNQSDIDRIVEEIVRFARKH